MILSLRRSAVAVTAGALLLALSPIAPSFAATKTTVTGTVLGIDGNPVRGVAVLGINLGDKADDGIVEFSATGADGTFSRARNGQLSAGQWVFIFQDSSDEYAAMVSDQTIVSGANTLDAPVQLQEGASIAGRVTAVSGAELKNIDVHFYNQALEVEDPSTFDPSLLFGGTGDNLSDVDGTYDVRPLVPGAYNMGISFGYEDDFQPVRQVSITAPGQALTQQNISNVRVPVATKIKAKASKSKGKATVSALVDASYFGIDSPGGQVKIYDGSKRLTTKTLSTTGKVSVSLSKLKKGKHKLHFKFSGATDTLGAKSRTAKITIK